MHSPDYKFGGSAALQPPRFYTTARATASEEDGGGAGCRVLDVLIAVRRGGTSIALFHVPACGHGMRKGGVGLHLARDRAASQHQV